MMACHPCRWIRRIFSHDGDVPQIREAVADNVRAQRATGTAAISMAMSADDLRGKLDLVRGNIEQRTERQDHALRALLNDVVDKVR